MSKARFICKKVLIAVLAVTVAWSSMPTSMLNVRAAEIEMTELSGESEPQKTAAGTETGAAEINTASVPEISEAARSDDAAPIADAAETVEAVETTASEAEVGTDVPVETGVSDNALEDTEDADASENPEISEPEEILEPGETSEPEEEPEKLLITKIIEPEKKTVEISEKLPLEEVYELLPKALEVEVEGAEETEETSFIDVSWECLEDYENSQETAFSFKAVLEGEQFVSGEGVVLPEIEVLILDYINEENGIWKNNAANTSAITYASPRFPVNLNDGSWRVATSNRDDHHVKANFSAVDVTLYAGGSDGKSVYIVEDGTIVRHDAAQGMIIVKHTKPLLTQDGVYFETWYTQYAHMKEISQTSGNVSKGFTIGKISNVGTADIHLHFQINSKFGTTWYNPDVKETAISPYYVSFDNANQNLVWEVGGSNNPGGNSKLRDWLPRYVQGAISTNIPPGVEKPNIGSNESVTLMLTDSFNTLDDTSATRAAYLTNPGGLRISETGMKLYNEAGALIAQCQEFHTSYLKKMWIYYATNSQTGINLKATLIPGTNYKFEIYAKVGNETKTVSGTFKTNGSVKPATPILTAYGTDYAVGDIATFTWNTVAHATNYTVTLSAKDGSYTKAVDTDMDTASFVLPNPGEYQVTIVAKGHSQSDEGTLATPVRANGDCQITFVEELPDGTVQTLKTDTVKYGKSAVAPTAPTRTGWVFQGWDKSYMNVTADVTVTALFTRNTYTVRFVNPDGTILKTDRVLYEGSVEPPEDPEPEPGYAFIGWDSEDYKSVTKNTTITAGYVYENAGLPIQLNVDSCSFDSDGTGYTVIYDIINYDEAITTGRVIVSLTTEGGRLLHTTESNAFTLKKSQTKSDVEIFVPYTGEAALAEVVIVNGFTTSIPVSEKKTVEVARSWSAWDTTEPESSITDVESRKEYRYRDKSATTSTSSSLEGWTYERTEGYWGDYGDWSGWSRNQYSTSDSRQAESRTVTDQAAYTLQTYYFYKYLKNGGWWYSYADRSGTAGVSNVEYKRVELKTSGDSRVMEYNGMDDGRERFIAKPYQFYQVEYFYKGSTRQVAAVTHPEWRFRDRPYLYRYHFYRWSDWSSWDTTPLTASGTREVEERTVYRYQTTALVTGQEDGTSRTVSGKVNESLAGKQALLVVYKNEEPADYNNEYLGQSTIGEDGSYSFTFVTREEPSVETGDFTIKMGIEGASELIYVGTIEAPKPEYTVNFIDWDGTLLDTQTVPQGNAAVAPAVPVREGYRFTGWNTGLTNIHDNLEIIAQYSREQCTVVFVDWGKKNFTTEVYDVGADIIFPVWNEVEGYEFVGWLDENGDTAVTAEENLVLTATYEVKQFYVKFYNQAGEVIDEQMTEYGGMVSAPPEPQIEGQQFAGWSTYEYTNVKRDLDIFPSYAYHETTATPQASITSGTLNEAADITLTCADSNAVILYTLDGSVPDMFSPVYSGPITVDQNTVLKFYARSTGKNDSNVISEAYLMVNAEDDAGALTIKKDVLNLLIEEDAPQITYFLYHENQDMGVQFYSLDDSVVSVDQEGNLALNNVGATQVFAVTNDFRYADYCEINVTTNEVKIDTLDITQNILSMVAGAEVDLGTHITPEDATYQDILWFSDDADVASVDMEGHLVAEKTGETYITALSQSGTNVAYCYVEVTDSPLTISQQEIVIAASQKYRLSASLVGGTQDLSWKSSNPNIASVTNDGLVEGRTPGMATVIVTAENGDFRACTVRVTNGETVVGPPAAPIIEKVTDTTITVQEQVDCEYSLNAKTWQKNREFTGLTPETAYTVYSRIMAGEGRLASPASEGTSVKTFGSEITVTNISNQTYTGQAIKPEVEVYYQGEMLAVGKDYSLSYKNNVKAAASGPMAVVKGKGNYDSIFYRDFIIERKDVSDADIIYSELIANINKKVQKPVPKITYGKNKLVRNKDFVLEYPETQEGAYSKAGTYTVLVIGIGNYSGSKELSFVITDKTLMGKAKVKSPAKITFDGTSHRPEVEVSYGGRKLVKEEDYTVHYPDSREGAYILPGTYPVVIAGSGDFIGSKTVNMTIKGISLTRAAVSGITAEGYSGDPVWQEDLKVELNEYGLLQKGEDYTLSYISNSRAGKAYAVITGINGYSGSIKKPFTISRYNLQTDTMNAVTYDDDRGILAYAKGGCKPEPEVYFNGILLKKDIDYSVKYKNNTALNDGSNPVKLPTVTITGKGNFSGALTQTFLVNRQNIDEVNAHAEDVIFKNKVNSYKVKPVITDINGQKLTAGKDYEKTIIYSYADGSAIGSNEIPQAGSELMATVIGRGSYTGELSVNYRIIDKSIAKASAAKITKIYTGNPIELRSGDLTVTLSGTILTEGTDFEIVENSYIRNINPGTATITIHGIGEYGGYRKVNFSIRKKSF